VAWIASGLTAITVLVLGLILSRRRTREFDREARKARVKADRSLH
jgi:hypothetical protein